MSRMECCDFMSGMILSGFQPDWVYPVDGDVMDFINDTTGRNYKGEIIFMSNSDDRVGAK